MNKLFKQTKLILYLVLVIVILFLCIYYFINKIYIYEGFYESQEEIFGAGSSSIWTVPEGVNSAEFIVIGGRGAGSNNYLGVGAKITTRLNTISGETYNIYVGNNGSNQYNSRLNPLGKYNGGIGGNKSDIFGGNANGGAASVVYKNDAPIIIAGGGGGPSGGVFGPYYSTPHGKGGNAGSTNLNGTGSTSCPSNQLYCAITGGNGGTINTGNGGDGTLVKLNETTSYIGGGGGGGLKGGEGGIGGGGGAGSSYVINNNLTYTIINASLSEDPSITIRYNKPIETTTTVPETTTTVPETTTTVPETTTTVPETTTTTQPTTTRPTTTRPTTTRPTTTQPTTTQPTTTQPTTTQPTTTQPTTTQPTTTQPTTTQPTTTQPTTTQPTTTQPTTTRYFTTTTLPTIITSTTTQPSFTQEQLNNYDDYTIGMMLKGMNNKHNLNDFIAKNTLLGNNLYISPMNQSGIDEGNNDSNVFKKTKKKKIIDSTFTPIIQLQ